MNWTWKHLILWLCQFCSGADEPNVSQTLSGRRPPMNHGWSEWPVPKMLNTTWWFIPLSKWVITLVISGLTPLVPFITRVITHLLSGMNHQVRINSSPGNWSEATCSAPFSDPKPHAQHSCNPDGIQFRIHSIPGFDQPIQRMPRAFNLSPPGEHVRGDTKTWITVQRTMAVTSIKPLVKASAFHSGFFRDVQATDSFTQRLQLIKYYIYIHTHII